MAGCLFLRYDAAQGVGDEAEMKLSDGEKLILVMLADIYKHLRIKGAVDPDLVHDAMYGGHAWGLRMEYPDILGSTDCPHRVTARLWPAVWFFVSLTTRKGKKEGIGQVR